MHICHNYITVSQNYLSRLVETISYFSNNQKKKNNFQTTFTKPPTLLGTPNIK